MMMTFDYDDDFDHDCDEDDDDVTQMTLMMISGAEEGDTERSIGGS